MSSSPSSARAAHARRRLGGSPFNVALGLARPGQTVEILTGVSGDVLGRHLLAFMEAAGMGLHHAVRSDRQTDDIPRLAHERNG
jgi:fructokinase